MTTMGETLAESLVSTVRWLSSHRLALSACGLIATLVFGVTYLVFGVLQVDPTAEKIRVRVHLENSGGLIPDQDVTLRGVPVGKVASVDLADVGVTAQAVIDANILIPEGSEVRVASLSMAGEQYLDFRPTSNDGPYLANGAEVGVEDTTTPVPMSTMLGNLDGMLSQVDPDRLATMMGELGVSSNAPAKLADIIDGGVFLISTLHSVLPQTAVLLRESQSALTLLDNAGPRLQSTSASLAHLLSVAESKDAGIRTFLNRTPGTMHAVDELMAGTSDSTEQLMGSLGTVAQTVNSRVPALNEFFFPTDRDGSTLAAIGSIFRDGGVWAFVNIYPRYACDYDLPRSAPWVADHPEPFLYTYCANEDPSVLIRGARNAPRPADDGAIGLPAGADPLATTTPTPISHYSVPLIYAGPEIPSAP